jgi:putative ATPase
MPGTVIKEIAFSCGRRFAVVVYDLLYEQTDCIVNAANSRLSHGGGAAAAICDAAGPSFEEECQAIVREQGPIPVGEAVVTSAGKLRFKGVIHAIGPQMGDGDEENKIVKALQSAFGKADGRGWTSLSFPAISSGIYRVPVGVCARAYTRAVKEFFEKHPECSLKTIRLCVFKGRVLDAVKKELGV